MTKRGICSQQSIGTRKETNHRVQISLLDAQIQAYPAGHCRQGATSSLPQLLNGTFRRLFAGSQSIAARVLGVYKPKMEYELRCE